MRIVVNGQQKDLPEGLTVAALIREMGLASAACAAEVNKTLIPRREHDARTLQSGDTVELVTLVGGG
jgi:sulfur carrier protein